ncbi:hypothetical protein EV2_014343 [Malus domestica]
MGFQSVVSKPPAAPMPVKFSHDIARLQHILSIRKAPLGAQIKFVIDLLRETRLSYTMEQINQARYVDRSFKVDDELKAHFRAIELPHDMIEIEKELQKNGMKPATDTAKRRALAETQGIPNKSSKPKAKKTRKRTKITNLHLPELFQDLIKN